MEEFATLLILFALILSSHTTVRAIEEWQGAGSGFLLAMSTSLPELMSAVLAGWSQESALLHGLILGSNHINGVILWAFHPLAIPLQQLPLHLGLMALLYCGIFHQLYWIAPWMLCAGLWYGRTTIALPPPSLLLRVVVLALVSYGMKKSVASIGLQWGYSSWGVGTVLLAIATNAPEIVTCTIAASKRMWWLIRDNLLGSNLFNSAIAWSSGALFLQPEQTAPPVLLFYLFLHTATYCIPLPMLVRWCNVVVGVALLCMSASIMP